MILVDTSVLIDYLRGKENEFTQRFQFVLDSGTPYGINSFIYQELLQGVRTENEFTLLKQYLDTQRFYRLRDERESFAQAARIYFDCRRKGIVVASTIDCLIAQTAIDNDLFLLHNDSDFERIAEVAKLKFYLGQGIASQ
jgi:Predicted nucleic acid-binding protein, contains PIN domain